MPTIKRLRAWLSRLFGSSSTTISIIAVLISLAGILYQHDQMALTKSQRELEVHAMLIDRNASILEMFVEKPKLRKYFFENISIRNNDEDHDVVMTIAELWTDFFEQVVIQLPYLSPTMAPTWRCYAIDMYKSSPAIRKHFAERRMWYALQLRELWTTNAACEV